MQTWWRVALPLVRPVTAAVAALTFVLTWSNFLDPLVYVYDRDLFTLPLALRSLATLDPTNFPVFLAGAVLATLPALVVFGLAQRRFLARTEGMASTMRTHADVAPVAGPRSLSSPCSRPAAATPEVAGGPVQLLVFGAPEELAAYRTLVDAYKRSVPGSDVQIIEASDRSDLIARLSTSIAGGSPPDVFLMNYRFYGQFATKGAIEPLDDADRGIGGGRPGGLLPDRHGRLPLARRTAVPAAERVQPRRLLQPRPVPEIRRARAEGGLDLERSHRDGDMR